MAITNAVVRRLPRFRPISRSRSTREKLAQSAKKRLTAYMADVAAQGRYERALDLPSLHAHRDAAITSLLWARADIERAIWQETSGRMGEQYASATSTLRTLPIRGASITDDNN